ncbi:methyl-accepting chemotaxis protein [Aphanothece sacrum]|uniref:Methyl-accepting chemotaxis protein n=1 Tax=Aphanothece sacrum FPU1 TaxID=1920663 RepID=A0A401IHJ8_APHSA|nr:methyl-accepting chemotaxis protein [Aphanothece sacrum]GBF80767.1 methyl-accepting chemotaxis protein [Aphanothece sacrum FPU1]GBF83262.1 methyl-accepting chemotaxis protein [Aphanothece sacrum FPU3]
MLNRLSLKTKAILFACGIGIIPMLVIGFTAYSSTNKQIVQQEITSQQYRTETLNNRVSRFLFERYGDINIISNLPFLRNPEIWSILSPKEKTSVLNRFIETYGVYDNVAVFDLKGNVIAKSSETAISNQKDQNYFQKVIKTGKTVINDVEIGQSKDKVFIYFAAPVTDSITGKMIGVARTQMPLTAIQDLLANFGKNGDEWHLIDNASGKIFAALEKGQIGRVATLDFPSLSQLQGTNKINTGISIDKIDGAEQLITYSPFYELNGLPPLNWSLLVASDTKNIFSTQHYLLIVLIIGTGITALIVSGMAIFFTNPTTKLLKRITDTLAFSANEIVNTVQQQELTINQQASSVNETTTTIEQLGASSLQSAQQAEASASEAQEALTIAENGTQAVHKTMEGMGTLKENVQSIAEQIMRLKEQTGQIATISNLVGDIANQTNMLALNAAVEAVHAGEQGKGFSVVAMEIRKLADESQKSAEKINVLVTDLQASINSTVTATDEGSKKTDESIKLAEGMAQAFAGVAEAVNHVFVNNQQIFASSKQQVVAVQQVIAAMNVINLGAQETSQGINQVRVSTDELKSAAQDLQAVV